MGKEIDFKVLCTISYGLYIVTSFDGDKLNGQISNTVFQVTATPPKLAVSVSKNELTHEYITKSKKFGVSALDDTTPFTLIGLFGFKSGREVDKLAQVQWKRGVTGCPLILEHVMSFFEVEVTQEFDVGTHTIFVGELVNAELQHEGQPLTYLCYREKLKGKSPENAPTHTIDSQPEAAPKPAALAAVATAAAQPSPAASASVEGKSPQPQAKERNGKMQKYECNVCGYIYDPELGDPDNGISPGTPFEQIPDSWVCPVCGVGKDEFSPVD